MDDTSCKVNVKDACKNKRTSVSLRYRDSVLNCNCTNTKYLDLDGSLDLEKDIVSGGFYLKDGVLQPLDSPGLGVKLI